MSDTSPKDAVKAVATVKVWSECFGVKTQQVYEINWTNAGNDLPDGDYSFYTAEALSQVRKQALLEAEQVRLRLAEKYQNGIDTNTADMNGNCAWARLEGAVAVVQALRKLAEE
jgi:hypothetical protein